MTREGQVPRAKVWSCPARKRPRRFPRWSGCAACSRQVPHHRYVKNEAGELMSYAKTELKNTTVGRAILSLIPEGHGICAD